MRDCRPSPALSEPMTTPAAARSSTTACRAASGLVTAMSCTRTPTASPDCTTACSKVGAGPPATATVLVSLPPPISDGTTMSAIEPSSTTAEVIHGALRRSASCTSRSTTRRVACRSVIRTGLRGRRPVRRPDHPCPTPCRTPSHPGGLGSSSSDDAPVAARNSSESVGASTPKSCTAARERIRSSTAPASAPGSSRRRVPVGSRRSTATGARASQDSSTATSTRR